MRVFPVKSLICSGRHQNSHLPQLLESSLHALNRELAEVSRKNTKRKSYGLERQKQAVEKQRTPTRIALTGDKRS